MPLKNPSYSISTSAIQTANATTWFSPFPVPRSQSPLSVPTNQSFTNRSSSPLKIDSTQLKLPISSKDVPAKLFGGKVKDIAALEAKLEAVLREDNHSLHYDRRWVWGGLAQKPAVPRRLIEGFSRFYVGEQFFSR